MPIDPQLFEKGLADARAGIRRSARALDAAPPDYVAGYLAAVPLEGVAAVDVKTESIAGLAERLYTVASRLEVPAPVPFVTRATVALLGERAESRARTRARALFDRELHQDVAAEGGPDQAAAAA